LQAIKTLITKLWDKRVTRFIVVGCFNTFLDITILLVLYEVFGLPKVVANTISVPTAITVSYFLNHRIVFRQKQGYSFVAYLKFLAITGFSALVIQDTIIYIVTTHMLHPGGATISLAGHQVTLATVDLLFAKLLGISVGLIWNFLLYKYVVFRHGKSDQADEILIA
jgi:putative flippase GtrA